MRDKEKVDAQRKAWREANKEKIAAQRKAWREANKEKATARDKAWREANKDKVAAKDKAYRETKPESVTLRNAKSNLARGLNIPPDQVPVDMVEAKALQYLVRRAVRRASTTGAPPC